MKKILIALLLVSFPAYGNIVQLSEVFNSQKEYEGETYEYMVYVGEGKFVGSFPNYESDPPTYDLHLFTLEPAGGIVAGNGLVRVERTLVASETKIYGVAYDGIHLLVLFFGIGGPFAYPALIEIRTIPEYHLQDSISTLSVFSSSDFGSICYDGMSIWIHSKLSSIITRGFHKINTDGSIDLSTNMTTVGGYDIWAGLWNGTHHVIGYGSATSGAKFTLYTIPSKTSGAIIDKQFINSNINPMGLAYDGLHYYAVEGAMIAL